MQNLTVKNLAVMNLKRKTYRTSLLIILIALSAAVLFASFVLVSSVTKGMASLQRRLGADLLVVPEGYEGTLEGLLLNGEPGYFYMDRSVEDTVKNVAGVEKTTSQFFLTSLSESCCDFPIQLIGFDVKSDFVITEWISERFKEKIGDGLFFVGYDVPTEKKTIKIFGKEHGVSSKLAKSGSGMDSAIYTDMDSLKAIYNDALERGFGFISDGGVDSKISTVLVKLAPNAMQDSTALKIQMAVPGLKVIKSQSFIDSFSKSLSSLLVFLYAAVLIFFIITFLSLALVFFVTVNERLKEFSILRVLGATHKTLSRIILWEAGIVSLTGGILGLILSVLVIFPFSTAIAKSIALPFIVPSLVPLIIFGAVTLAAVFAAGILASVKSVFRIARFEPYGAVK